MRLLLDTHIALWAITNDRRLSATAGKLIADPAHDIFFSVVSLWEISIKHAHGQTKPGGMPVNARLAENLFQQSGYLKLDISSAHIHALENLPPIHDDPFDRLLLAQAYEMPLRFLTHDQILPLYGDYVLGV